MSTASTEGFHGLAYQVAVDGFPRDHFRVQSVTGREEISRTYRFHVVASARSAEDLDHPLVGRRAVLIWNVGHEQRAFYGIVAAARVDDRQGSFGVHLRLVPRLWLLERRRRSRIFQRLRVPDIVTAVLREAGIAVRWQLKHPYPVREYCTQYEETDYHFVRRLLAEAAIYFYFPQGPELDPAALAAGWAASAALDVSGSLVGGGFVGGGLAAGAGALGSVGAGVASVVSAVTSAASPIIPGDTVICADDAVFYPPIGGDYPAGLLEAAAAALIPDVAAGVGASLAVGASGASLSVDAAISVGAPRPAPTLYYLAMLDTATSAADKVARWTMHTSVRSNRAVFRDYDPERPMAPLWSAASATPGAPGAPTDASVSFSTASSASATLDAGAAFNAGGSSGGGISAGASFSVSAGVAGLAGLAAELTGRAPTLEVYDHHAPFLFPKWGLTGEEAARMLRQERRRVAVAEGESGCSALAPGHRFTLSDSPLSHLDGPYVVTRVEHRGLNDPGMDQQAYACSFTCVPGAVTYVPKRPPRESVQVALTATVVGPPGEEIHVDPMGQIRVQFHWDREGRLDEHSSCWIRTMHAWGGAGWGAQFIPRVGMEVVVTFEGGDPDKPMVLGALYNGTHPSPFPLPADKTRSGWRTQTYPGGPGFNELSFEDARGREQVFLHAQRDHDEVVERDHTLRVGHDETIHVLGTRRDHLGVDLLTAVDGKRETTVAEDDTTRVEGSRLVESLDAHATVRRHEVVEVGATARREVTGLEDQHNRSDKTLRVDGNLTTVVGHHEAKRTFVVHAEGRAVVESTDVTEIASDGELVLRCGGSRLRLTPDRVELSSDKGLTLRSGNTVVEVTPDRAKIRSKEAVVFAKTVNLLTDADAGKAQVKLTEEVKITGLMVKLNPPITDQEQDTDPKPPPPTKLAFKDSAGRPLVNQRFVIHFDDGSEVAGVLDHEGRAELELEGGGSAKIAFPEVCDVKPG